MRTITVTTLAQLADLCVELARQGAAYTAREVSGQWVVEITGY